MTNIMLTIIDHRLLHDFVQCVNDAAGSPMEKNVNVLLKAAAACRAIGGIVCTLCKSGKSIPITALCAHIN